MKFICHDNWSRQEKFFLGVVVLLAVLMMAIRSNETPIGANTDDAYYIEMARSIAEGLGPVLNTGPDVAPTNPDIFPPGLPLLLSPIAKLFPHSLSPMKVLPVFFTLLLIPLCLTLPGPHADKQTKLMVTALVMLNPWVIAWSGRVLSDTVFAVVSLAALLVFSSMKPDIQQQKRHLLALILLCALAISVRTVGWTVVVTISIILVFRRQFWLVLGFILAVVVILVPGWLLQSGEVAPISGAYWTQMFTREAWAVWPLISNNLLHYLAELPMVLVPVFGAPVAGVLTRFGMGGFYLPALVVLGCALFWLICFSAVKFSSQSIEGSRFKIFTLYLVVYGGVLLNFDGYPSGVQTRLLIPVLPILCWFVVVGLREVSFRKFRILPNLVFGMMILAALAHNGWRMAYPLRTSVDAEGRGFVDPGAGAVWIVENTASSDIIMVQEPLQRHIHFRRDVIGFPETISETDLLAKLNEFGVGIVFLGPSVHFLPNRLDERGTAMLQLMKSMPEVFKIMENDLDEGIFVFSRI